MKPEIVIREALPEDWDGPDHDRTTDSHFYGIEWLLRECGLLDSYFTREKYLAMLKRNPRLCFVAEDTFNRTIVGCQFGTHDGATRGYLQKLGVARNYRREELALS